MLVQSPCIGVCRVAARSGLCVGCFRTLEEIAGWAEMLPQQQRKILLAVQQRQLAGLNPDQEADSSFSNSSAGIGGLTRYP